MPLRHQHNDTHCQPIEPRPDPIDVPDTQPKGRICPNDGTHLSIYNPNDFCWQCVHKLDQQLRDQDAERRDRWHHTSRPKRFTPDEVAARLKVIDELRDRDLGWTEIADILDVRPNTVQQFYAHHAAPR